METPESTAATVRALQQRVEQLEAANRLRDEFLGKLAHELGNLFLPYQFAQQLLRQSVGDAATMGQVRGMLEEHERSVRQFMADLRTVSRLMRGKITAQRQPVDLRQIVEQSLSKAKPAIESQRLSLSLESPSQASRMEGDPALLEQMVDHLLNNAIKFTRSGGRIKVTLAQQGGKHVLKVRDSGIGIEPHHLPQLFTPFFQADPTGAGWGAGLAIIRGVAELHGGRVEASSAGPGQGSEFMVSLPGV
jgi:signal transduction histidine kinase